MKLPIGISDETDSTAHCFVMIIIIMLKEHDCVDCNGDDYDYDDEFKKDDSNGHHSLRKI